MISSLVTGVVLSVSTWWLYKRQTASWKPFFWPALVFKLLAGLLVGWLYFSHYGEGDTISYWLDGNTIAAALSSDTMGTLNFFWDESGTSLASQLHNGAPRSVFFAKICAVLSWVTGGQYGMMSLIISWISFWGAWFLFTTMSDTFPAHRLASAIAFLFFPSVVFWSSGLIKESLGLASIYVMVALLLFWFRERKYVHWFWLMPLALWVGWNLKYYWLGILMPVMITIVFADILIRWKPGFKKYDLVIWLVLFLVILVAGTQLHPNFYPQRFAEVIVQSNHEFMAITPAAHAVEFPDLKPSFLSILSYSPYALWTGLFRPFVTETYNFFSTLAAAENLILLLLMLAALPSLRTVFASDRRMLVLACIIYIILMAIFLTLSTPNFGTLSRYKIGFLPLLVFLIGVNNPLIFRIENILKPKGKRLS